MKKLISILIAVVLICAQSQFVLADTKNYDVSAYSIRCDALTKLGLIEEKPASHTSKITYVDFAEIVGKIIGYEDNVCEYFGIKRKDSDYNINYDNAAKILISVLGRNIESQIKDYHTVAKKIGLNDGVINFGSEFSVYDAVFMVYNALKSEMLEQTVFGKNDKYENTGRTLSDFYLDAHYFEGFLSANEYGSIVSGANTGNDFITVDDFERGTLNIKTGKSNIDTYSFLGCMVEGFYFAENENSVAKELVSINYSTQNDTLVLNYADIPFFNESKRCIEYVKNGKIKTEKLDFSMDLIYNGQCVTEKPGDVLKTINNLSELSLGSIVLSDKDGNGKYDAVSVYVYKNFVVDGKSSSEFKLYGMDNEFISLEKEYSQGRVSIVNSGGKTINYSDLQSGDILSIHESMAKDSVIRIVVFKNTFFGQVNYSSNNGIKLFGIETFKSEDQIEDGKLVEFEFAKNSDSKKIRIGEFYNFYVDYTGRIAKAVLSNTRERHYGLFVKISKENGGLGGNRLKAMIMTDLNSAAQPRAEVVDLSDNAKYNGLKITENNIAQINSELFHTVITYYTTSEGKIKSIIGSDNGTEDSLISKNRADTLVNESELPNSRALMFAKNPWIHFSVTDTEIKSGLPYTHISIATPNAAYTGLVPVGNNKVICVPDIPLSKVSMSYADDFYKVLPLERFEYFHNTGKAAYKAVGYYEKDSVLPIFTVYFSSTDEKPKNYEEMTSHDRILLVNDVKSTVNPITERNCIKIAGMYGGEEVEMYTKYDGILDYTKENGYIDVSEGDLLFVVFDANGLITYGLRFYDYDPKTKDGKIEEYMDGSYGIYRDCTATYDFISKYFITKGLVYNEGPGNSGITLADSVEAMENDGLTGGIHGFAKPIKHIYFYDTKMDEPEKRVGKGSLNSGITYYEDKTDVSTAIIRHKGANCMDVVIYK